MTADLIREGGNDFMKRFLGDPDTLYLFVLDVNVREKPDILLPRMKSENMIGKESWKDYQQSIEEYCKKGIDLGAFGYSGIVQARIEDVAFRKIKGAELPQSEFIELNTGGYLLTTTGFDGGETNLYQIKFDKDGRIVKPSGKMEIVEYKPFEDIPDFVSQRVQIGVPLNEILGDPHQNMNISTSGCTLYLYGLDGSGNLYYYKREFKNLPRPPYYQQN